ncbi:AlbA family DNA-binding domain-containing protein [Marisediminicola senii]|uniref:AlbA family DNA-binding domain-containing protein n=1 Tax=Marisediminicola senii TaxID=2711233 RepID=UPI0013EC9D27|nr:ATP-binding protein [Marisediminicola senii]
MKPVFPPRFAALVVEAYRVGAETTLDDLASRLELGEGDALEAALQVLDAVRQFDLEIDPNIRYGTLDSPRVLRLISSPDTTEQRVLALLESGEGPAVEYKSSLLASMHHWNKQSELFALPALPGEVLKTICAFLNSEGGDLLIGVNDGGEACDGIAVDLQLKGWNLDKWQLHLATLIRDRFHDGIMIWPYVRIYTCTISGNSVAHVQVLARSGQVPGGGVAVSFGLGVRR